MLNLIFLTCFVLLAFLTAVVMILAGVIFSYKKRDSVKSSTYECGLKPIKSANICFHIRYFNYLIMFLIVEISSIFLYPLMICCVSYSCFRVTVIIIFLLLLLFSIFLGVKLKFIGERK